MVLSLLNYYSSTIIRATPDLRITPQIAPFATVTWCKVYVLITLLVLYIERGGSGKHITWFENFYSSNGFHIVIFCFHPHFVL